MRCNRALHLSELESPTFNLTDEKISHLLTEKNDDKMHAFLEAIKKDQPKQLSAALKSIAYQLGILGDEAKILKFLEKLKTDPCYVPRINGFLRNIIVGFAKAKHQDTALAFIGKIISADPENTQNHFNDLYAELMYGFSNCNHESETYTLLDILKNNNPSSIFHYLLLKNIALGFAKGGHKTASLTFIDKIKVAYPDMVPSLLSEIAYGFTYDGFAIEIDEILKELKTSYPICLRLALSDISWGFARNRSKAETYTFLEKVLAEYPNHVANTVKSAVIGLHQINQSIEQSIILKILTLTNYPSTCIQLASELRSVIKNFDVLKLVPQAIKFRHVMEAANMSYPQVIGRAQPEIQIFLLQGVQLLREKKLTNAVFLHIATFLSTMTLPEICDLSNKMALEIHNRRFFNNLKNQGFRLLMMDNAMNFLDIHKRKHCA
jgi:hypothetical protein